jgi:hypothetical protein
MTKKEDPTKKTFKMLGEAILYGSIQFSIGSVEMSSKFSVKNFSKDQETLQNAADALMDYVKISFIWTIGVTLLLFSKYGWLGAISSIVSNLIVVGWIFYSYVDAFNTAVKKTSSTSSPLKFPKLHILTPSVSSM